MGKTSFTIAFLKPEIASGVYNFFTPAPEKAPLSSRNASAPGSSIGSEDPSDDGDDASSPPHTPLRSSIVGVSAVEASLLYPDGQILSNIFERITHAGFFIHSKRMVELTKPQVRSLFAHEALRLKDDAKFRDFLESFTSGLSMALLLAYPESTIASDAINRWKALVGHENPVVARQDALSASLPHDEWPLHALCGLNAVQNAIQSSASLDCFYRERAFVFPHERRKQNRVERAVLVLFPSFLSALPDGKALLLAKLNADGVLVTKRVDDYQFATVKELSVVQKELHPVTNEQHRKEFMLALQHAVGMEADTAGAGSSSNCCCLLEVDALDLFIKLRGILGPASIKDGHLYFPENVRAQLPAPLVPSLSHVRTAENEATCLESGIFVSFGERTIAALTTDASNEIQQTFAIIKPGTASDPTAVHEIQNAIRAFGFAIEKQRRLRLSRAQAATFYGEHRGKAFFERLLAFMTSGELVAMQLARTNAIVTWRGLMGPTNAIAARETHPWTLRARFGIDGTRNATHGSDAPASARRELKFFFGGGLQAFAASDHLKTHPSTKVLAQSRLPSPYSANETLESVMTQALDEMLTYEVPTQLDACTWLGTWLLEYAQRQQLKQSEPEKTQAQSARAKTGGLQTLKPAKSRQKSAPVTDPLEQHFGSNRTLLAVSYAADVSPQLRVAVRDAICAMVGPRFVFLDVGSVLKAHKDLQSGVMALVSQLKAAGKRRFLLHDMDTSSSVLIEAFNAQIDWRVNSVVIISSSAMPVESATTALAPVVPHVLYQLPLQSADVANDQSFKTFSSGLLDPVLVLVCDQQKRVETSQWRVIAQHFGFVLLAFDELVHKRIAKESDPNGPLTQLVRTRAKIPSELLCALVSDVVRTFQPTSASGDHEALACAQKFLLCGFPFAEALPTAFEQSVAPMHRLLHVHSKHEDGGEQRADVNGWISHASKRGVRTGLWIDPMTSPSSSMSMDELRETCALSFGPLVGFCIGEVGGEGQLMQLKSAAQALGFVWLNVKSLCPPQEDALMVVSALMRVLLRANAGHEKFLLYGFPSSKAALVAFIESVCVPRFAILSTTLDTKSPSSSTLLEVISTLDEFPQIVQLDISQSPEANKSNSSSLSRLQSVLFGKRVSFLVGDTADLNRERLQSAIAAHGYNILDLRKPERPPEVDTSSNDVVHSQVRDLVSQIQASAVPRCLVIGAPEHLSFVSNHLRSVLHHFSFIV